MKLLGIVARLLAVFSMSWVGSWSEPGLAARDPGEEQEPREIGLLEKTASRLAQLDITVSGDPEVLSRLSAEDFTIKINYRRLERFQIDRLCDISVVGGSAEAPGEPLGGSLPVTYLFYFDQAHMSLGGRQRSLDLTRQLIPDLIRNGNRGIIVSNASRLKVIEDLTDDPGRLIEALDRLEHDRGQWDLSAMKEESRIAELMDVLNEANNVQRAISRARGFQREERFRTERNLRRLAITLARLADVDLPKAVLYFADTMRSNAGEHYMSFFGQSLRQNDSVVSMMGTDSLTAALPFDRVVREASAQGIRFYTVRAAGLVTPFDAALPNPSAMTMTSTVTSSSRVRYSDAQNTLANMAAETGGHAFLRGSPAPRIARRIRKDLSCLFLASFDPTGFPEDSPLRVVVQLRPDGVRAHARGSIVMQSESTRLAARLLGAFSMGQTADLGMNLRAQVLPTGFEDGAYSALLQVSVPPTALTQATWDLGASIVFRDKVREELSGRLAVARPGVPLILEGEVSLRPGAHEITAVAHETGSELILSEELRLVWSHPDQRPATAGPIALLQPTSGAFLRAGRSRASGSLVRADGEPVYTELPTALVGLVCRGKRQRGTLRVERRLLSEREVPLPALEFSLEDDRCAQVRDVIPADSLEPGVWVYSIRVTYGDEAPHEASREFLAIGPES